MATDYIKNLMSCCSPLLCILLSTLHMVSELLFDNMKKTTTKKHFAFELQLEKFPLAAQQSACNIWRCEYFSPAGVPIPRGSLCATHLNEQRVWSWHGVSLCNACQSCYQEHYNELPQAGQRAFLDTTSECRLTSVFQVISKVKKWW